MENLAAAGVANRMLNLITQVLQEGEVAVEDGVGELPAFSQTTGVAQDDNLSPLLFFVLLSDLPGRIRAENDTVHTICYVDDAVFHSRPRRYLQRAMRNLRV